MIDLKSIFVRDQKFLDYLKTCNCLFFGGRGEVDPVHIGTGGKNLKISDSMAIPLSHSLHMLGHQKGEITMIRHNIPNDVLRDSVRLYAHFQIYTTWVEEGRPATYKSPLER